jgi:hypothetical protein
MSQMTKTFFILCCFCVAKFVKLIMTRINVSRTIRVIMTLNRKVLLKPLRTSIPLGANDWLD